MFESGPYEKMVPLTTENFEIKNQFENATRETTVFCNTRLQITLEKVAYLTILQSFMFIYYLLCSDEVIRIYFVCCCYLIKHLLGRYVISFIGNVYYSKILFQ